LRRFRVLLREALGEALGMQGARGDHCERNQSGE
jgi:hypothetical protein